MIHLLQKLLEHFTYVALIAVLVVSGLGVPIPEDIPLVFSGYLCSKEHSPIADLPMIDTNGDGIPDKPARAVPKLPLMIIAGMIGVLAGDSIVFTFGRRGVHGDNFVARHLRKVLHSKRREKVERHFAKHGNLTVFAGRFMPGFRSIVFAFAGMSKMSYPRFLVIDGMAAAISVPIFIFLGHHFAETIKTDFFGYLSRQKRIVLPVLGVILLGLALLYIVRRRRAAAAEAAL
jgi:membrane protein DedA with SNARE-associated domain